MKICDELLGDSAVGHALESSQMFQYKDPLSLAVLVMSEYHLPFV